MSFARYSPIMRSPKQRIFASLCNLENLADVVSEQTTALIPFILFAAMLTPIPLPHIKIPFLMNVFLHNITNIFSSQIFMVDKNLFALYINA